MPPKRIKKASPKRPRNSPVRIVSISLPSDLAKKIKSIAFSGNTSVSGLVERALSVYIGARSTDEVARRLNREGITHKRRY
jgi:metal-responsive CopG/Arc/MetJ family transcriptional regulator